MKNKIINNYKGSNILNVIITFIFACLVYFFFLPAINIQSIGFWVYVSVVLGMFALLILVKNVDSKGKITKGTKLLAFIGTLVVSIFVVITSINLVLSPLFFSKDYSKRITVDENNKFLDDVKQVDFNKLPLLDKDSSQKLGDRVMGQLPELVSQFYVSSLYTQINYNDSIIRVTPLEYNGFFKYLANRKSGTSGYITVDSVSGDAKLIKLKKGMKYMPSAILMENLDRKLRFSYPTKIFGEKAFEVDNEGNPYWIIPTLKYTGVEIRTEVEGAVILDPTSGSSKYYKVKDIPTWVDHVYSADLIIEQLDDWGQYKSGFLNSLFGQKNVTMTTEGYNYLVMNDDVYVYTGITSVAADQSNIGFILTNMRTKKTHFYALPGAEEYSAMASAEGQVQQMKYVASFPLLINLNGKATYLMSLKDAAGLVKMYAFVDVADYQKVVVTDASSGIEEAAQNYLGDQIVDGDQSNTVTKTITVNSINPVIIKGYTNYYITDTEGNKYSVLITVNKSILPFVTKDSTITVSYKNTDNEIKVISKIK